MAAPMRKVVTAPNLQHFARKLTHSSSGFLQSIKVNPRCHFRCQSTFRAGNGSTTRLAVGLKAATAVTVGCGLTVYLTDLWRRAKPVVLAASEAPEKPEHTPIRVIKSDTDNSGLKLTLYQYQTCPFCCKVRAYLDYHGFSYNVVEVNSVWRTELKWTKYPKVPIMVVEGCGKNGFIQVNDSSVIVSVLETFLEDPSQSLDKILACYPAIETKEKKKKKYEFPNKYFIMYGHKDLTTTEDFRKEERKWRRWVDEDLVHVLSPNIYRSVGEATQAFHYFSEVGEWEKVFTSTERTVVMYVGAAAMFLVGKILKRRHNLQDDVRQALYDDLNVWLKAVGKKRKFMGGDQPNMADLAVYGTLSSIEGCPAFQDALEHTKIRSWFERTKKEVKGHSGSHPLNTKHL